MILATCYVSFGKMTQFFAHFSHTQTSSWSKSLYCLQNSLQNGPAKFVDPFIIIFCLLECGLFCRRVLENVLMQYFIAVGRAGEKSRTFPDMQPSWTRCWIATDIGFSTGGSGWCLTGPRAGMSLHRKWFFSPENHTKASVLVPRT